MNVFVEKCDAYQQEQVDHAVEKWTGLFQENIAPGNTVVLKPNWLAHSHKYNPDEWLSVITHPTVITAVLKLVIKALNGKGKVIITDAPQTDSTWVKIMGRMQPELWKELGRKAGIVVEVLDLREDEWINEGDVTVSRKKLPGDPLGSTECDLGQNSEFVGHSVSKKGYYGADYDKSETNRAHSNGHHKYRVSRTVVEADVFVNIPKMKTHKKAGITCSLKNLVGINTYKNYLPHHNEGTRDEGGDQFPGAKLKNKTELMLIEKFKSILHKYPESGKLFVPVKKLGKKLFGDTRETIRSGNWYGNDTLWRMVLDLNKVLMYSEPSGELRADALEKRKKYISVVDGIIAGEGNGPEAPDPIQCGALIAGTNPVAVDAMCAKLMGLDWHKIPSIKNAFDIQKYPLCDFTYDELVARSSVAAYNTMLDKISADDCFQFRPHFGWAGWLECNQKGVA